MRWRFGAVAVVAAGLAVTVSSATSAAKVATRGCQTRVEGDKPTPFRMRGDVVLGPVAFRGLQRAAGAAELTQPGQRVYLYKAGASVRADRVVSVSIAPEDRGVAGLTYARTTSLKRVDDAHGTVRFKACGRDEPAFAYDGVVGGSTGFNGGFILARPACVDLIVRVRGRSAPYRRTVSFGMRDECE